MASPEERSRFADDLLEFIQTNAPPANFTATEVFDELLTGCAVFGSLLTRAEFLEWANRAWDAEHPT